DDGTVTTFTVESADGDQACDVTIDSDIQRRGGIAGTLERMVLTRFLRRVFDAELKLLERVARAPGAAQPKTGAAGARPRPGPGGGVTAPGAVRPDAAGAPTAFRSPWLLAIAGAGFILPNGLFVYWLFREWNGFAATMANHLAAAFMLDAFAATALLAWFFAKRPIGPLRWPWFVVLSLIGGLWF